LDDLWTRFSGEVRGAWLGSALAGLSHTTTGNILQGAVEIRLPVGPLPSPSFTPDQDTVFLLVVSGLVRTFRRNDTRQVTTRYAGRCDFVGIPSVIRHGSSAHGEILADAHMLRMVPGRLREAVRHDAASAWVVMQEVARLHDAAVDMACDNVFLSVRQRVARHLLDLAAREPDGLIVYASHQDIANAVGSVREVVSRALRELREEGLVTRTGDRLVLTRPAGLTASHR
jgi:CRP-like cAMP-binding protein